MDLATRRDVEQHAGHRRRAIESDLAGGAFTFGGLERRGAIALIDTGSNAVALTVGNNNSSNTYSGALSGPGSLTTVGTGLFVLSGTDTYLGHATISSGTLQAGVGGSVGSLGDGDREHRQQRPAGHQPQRHGTWRRPSPETSAAAAR